MKTHKRVDQTGEVFTPTSLVDKIIQEKVNLSTKKELIILDPACGDGEFLRGIVREFIRLQDQRFMGQQREKTLLSMLTGPTIDQKNNTFVGQLWGVDLMWDNIADSLFFLLTTYDKNEANNWKKRRSVDTFLARTGFEEQPHENATPEEINSCFTGERVYILPDKRKLYCWKEDKHVLNFFLDQDEFKLTHIIRANSLTEWDFENWCPKNGQPEQKESQPAKSTIEDLLIF